MKPQRKVNAAANSLSVVNRLRIGVFRFRPTFLC